MKGKAKVVLMLLLGSASLALAQRGGTMHIGHRRAPADSDQLLKATDDQRKALAKCMEDAEQLRSVAGRMPRIGSPWSRSRLSYTESDVSALAAITEQLKADLDGLTATHEKFRKQLTDKQRSQFERRLRKLDHLQAKMNSTVAELDRQLAKAKPGPASPSIAWDVNSIKRAADKWHSEHRKIAKELGIPS